MKKLAAAAVFAAMSCASPVFAGQLVLTPASVIGSSGAYSGQFSPGSIFDNQFGTVSEPAQSGYWLNPDNGPANAYLTIDLGGLFSLSSFTLFNTHNSQYNDRGTGNFSIIGASTLAGLTTGTTLASGTLAPASSSTPSIAGQSFASSGTGTFRYLQFLPTSVATAPDGVHASPCCGTNVYGLNELRVFGSVPEPGSWAMMIGGFGLMGGVMRRRRTPRRAVLG